MQLRYDPGKTWGVAGGRAARRNNIRLRFFELIDFFLAAVLLAVCNTREDIAVGSVLCRGEVIQTLFVLLLKYELFFLFDAKGSKQSRLARPRGVAACADDALRLDITVGIVDIAAAAFVAAASV